jgi:calcium-independent phospholipase A2-gamma
MTGEGNSIVRFTDYHKSGGEQSIYNDIKIWEAARATSAATSFFARIKITSGGITREYLDGGLGSNNPVDELWQEAAQVWPSAPLEPQIRCLLSIGTGKPLLESFGESLKAVGRSIIKIATETQRTAIRFHNNHEDLFNQDRAFRFDPPDIVNEVGLEDASKKAIIAARTEHYGNDPETRNRLRRFKQTAGEEQSASTPDHLALLQSA